MTTRFWAPLAVLCFLIGLALGSWVLGAPEPVQPTSEHICREEAWNAYTAGLLRDALETNPALRALAARRPPLPPVGFDCPL